RGVPVLGAVRGESAMIGKHDEGRQVFVHAPEAIAHPATHSGEAGTIEAGGLQERALRMHTGLADHVMNESEFIDDAAERRDRFAELLAALAVRLEFPERSEPGPEPILERLDVLAELGRLAVPLNKFRLKVEQIDMTGAAGHEQLHDALRLGGV